MYMYARFLGIPATARVSRCLRGNYFNCRRDLCEWLFKARASGGAAAAAFNGQRFEIIYL